MRDPLTPLEAEKASMASSDPSPLLPPPGGANPTALGYVLHVALRGYRWWLLGMLAGETGNAACGILLPVESLPCVLLSPASAW